jgi:hypothetical protein
MATPEVHCLKGPKSPFLLDDSVGRCIESFTYAATALWPVADPIHRSVTHTCSAETVTDLTLPKCGATLGVEMSSDSAVHSSRRGYSRWRVFVIVQSLP